MSSANALTSLLLALVIACLPAVMSITSAVYAICAICGSVSLASSASAGPLKSVIAAIAALHRTNMTDSCGLWIPSLVVSVRAQRIVERGPLGERGRPGKSRSNLFGDDGTARRDRRRSKTRCSRRRGPSDSTIIEAVTQGQLGY